MLPAPRCLRLFQRVFLLALAPLQPRLAACLERRLLLRLLSRLLDHLLVLVLLVLVLLVLVLLLLLLKQ